MKTYFDVLVPDIQLAPFRVICRCERYECDKDDVKYLKEQLMGQNIEYMSEVE